MESMEQHDAETVAAARDGDAEAFRNLVERHSRSVFRLAYRLTGSEPDAEDVVQETFFRVHRQLDRFEQHSSFSTWLYRITVNCAYDLMRKRRRHDDRHESIDAGPDGPPPLPAAGAAPDRQVFNFEMRKMIVNALDSLSHMERAAVILRHYEGLSIGEIGQILGLGTSAAKHSVFRAVRKMRRELQPLASMIR
jgi:RNA polymerase sigma-70 factor (ECF subfamily)